MNTLPSADNFAARFSERERRRRRLYAYASTWFGCFSEVMLDSSAIIILFITMLRGSATMAMLSTSLTALAAIFLNIPGAAIADRIGLRRAYTIACYLGCGGFLAMAAAPALPPPLDLYLVLAGCLVFCVSRSFYGVTWYPLLDNILMPAERSRFFGKMRYTYLSLTAAGFFLLSLALGEEPPLWAMQVVIAAAGLMLIGRKLCLDRLPVNARERGGLEWKKSLGVAIRNLPLTGWAVYVCCLGLASSSLLPLTLIYLKREIQAPADVVQWISVAYMAGLIFGYLLSARLLRRYGVRVIQPLGHLFYIASGLAMFLIGPGVPGFFFITGAILFLLGFWVANCLCCYSIELLALARPGNKVMAAAYLSTYNAIGAAASRFATSMIIGAGILAPYWTRWGLRFSSYQTLFLIFTALQVFFLLMLALVPSIVPKHDDYYAPA